MMLKSPELDVKMILSASSILFFDTVAIHLAHSTAFLSMERMGVRVDGQGYTRSHPNANPFNVATEWQDMEGYLDELVRRILAPVVKPCLA